MKLLRCMLLLLFAGVSVGACSEGGARVILPQDALAPLATWAAEAEMDWIQVEGFQEGPSIALPPSSQTPPVAEATQVAPSQEFTAMSPVILNLASAISSAAVPVVATKTAMPTATYTPAPIASPSSTHTRIPVSLTPIPVTLTTQIPIVEPSSTVADSGGSGPGNSGASCSPVGNGSFENQVIVLINDLRRDRGLQVLTSNATLTAVARGHSQEMACEEFFSHTSSSSGSPFDRLAAAGYAFSWAGENIAAGYGAAGDTVAAWMDSAGHRENILGENYTQIGIGYAYLAESPYGVYVTAVFASP